MGKQGTPKATAKQTAAKSIAKTKAAPKGSAGKDASADAGSGQQMSAFVTSMKYKLTGQNKEQASTAQQLLDKYAAMDNDGKRTMAKTYAEHGPKDLSWAAQYTETSNHDNIEEKSKSKGYMTRKQIFEAEGMNEATKETCLQELLQAFYARIGSDPSKDPSLVKKHDKVAAMSKFYYEFEQNILEKEVDSKSSSLSINAQGFKMDQANKMLADGKAGQVKIENPSHVELLAKVKAVWTAKQKLDREEAALKDCLADLEHAAVNKKSLKDIVSDFTKKMQLLHDFLISIRKAYAKVTKLEPSDESGCKKALDEFVDFGNLMLVHQEGVKTMKASMKALT